MRRQASERERESEGRREGEGEREKVNEQLVLLVRFVRFIPLPSTTASRVLSMRVIYLSLFSLSKNSQSVGRSVCAVPV